MSNYMKASLCTALALALCVLYVYLTWDSAHVVARQWIALGPIRWIDFASGAFVMFIVMLALFVGITLRETDRFDREFGGGSGPAGGSGGAKRIRMPLSKKVIDIKTWQPPDGRYHRGVAAPA
jgi:hypothetical protein